MFPTMIEIGAHVPAGSAPVVQPPQEERETFSVPVAPDE